MGLKSFFSRRQKQDPGVTPFTGKGEFDIKADRNAYTIKGPVPDDLVRAANGTYEPEFWEDVISKWRAQPGYVKKSRDRDKKLYALIRREYAKRYKPKTVTVTKAAAAPKESKEFTKLLNQMKSLEDKVKKQNETLKKKDEELKAAKKKTESESRREIKSDLDVPFITGSTEAIEAMRESEDSRGQDIYGRELEEGAVGKATKKINLTPKQAELFEQVRTNEKSMRDIPAGQHGLFTAWRQEAQGRQSGPSFEGVG